MKKLNYGKILFEEALDKTGYGLYSYMMLAVTGLCIIAYACTALGSTIIVPVSACELQTTSVQQGVLAAVPLIGTVAGNLIWGYLADTYGRRSMLVLGMSLAILFNTITSFSVNWIMMLVFQFVTSFLVTAAASLSVTLLSECVPMAKRNVLLMSSTTIALLSQGVLTMMSIPIIPLPFSIEIPALGIFWNSWRTLILVFNLPSFLAIVLLKVLFRESPKFLMAKDREDEALEVLAHIHRVNGFSAKHKTVFEVSGLIKESLCQDASGDDEDSKQSKFEIKALFTPPLLKSVLIMSTLFAFAQVTAFQMWLPRITNEFVKSVTVGETGSNLCGLIRLAIGAEPDPNEVPCSLNQSALIIVVIIGCIMSFFNLIVSLLVNRIGRRTLIQIVTLFSGVSGVLVNLMPQAISSAVFFIMFLMGATIQGLYTAVAVALFPTTLRAQALSLTMAVGQLTNFGVIQLLNYMLQQQCELAFYLFAIIFATSAVVALFLPDDKKQMEELKKKNAVEAIKS